MKGKTIKMATDMNKKEAQSHLDFTNKALYKSFERNYMNFIEKQTMQREYGRVLFEYQQAAHILQTSKQLRLCRKCWQLFFYTKAKCSKKHGQQAFTLGQVIGKRLKTARDSFSHFFNFIAEYYEELDTAGMVRIHPTTRQVMFRPFILAASQECPLADEENFNKQIMSKVDKDYEETKNKMLMKAADAARNVPLKEKKTSAVLRKRSIIHESNDEDENWDLQDEDGSLNSYKLAALLKDIVGQQKRQYSLMLSIKEQVDAIGGIVMPQSAVKAPPPRESAKIDVASNSKPEGLSEALCSTQQVPASRIIAEVVADGNRSLAIDDSSSDTFE